MPNITLYIKNEWYIRFLQLTDDQRKDARDEAITKLKSLVTNCEQEKEIENEQKVKMAR